MSNLARQAFVVTASRLINQGLMIISPVVLVRLLTVEDFGRYREFLLYTTVLGNLAAFSLPNSLLYFVGRQPAAALGYARRIALALGVSSTLTVLLFWLLEVLMPQPMLAGALLPCVLYVLFFTNLDFWEFLWLAQGQSSRVLAYTSGRLTARMVLVCGVAWFTSSVEALLWSLVALEGLRLAISTRAWRRMAARAPRIALDSSWREQLAFCVPSGVVVFVATFNGSIGGMLVGQTLGEAALAQLVVGSYLLMIISPLRNSVSDVLMPSLSAQARDGGTQWVPAWRRSTVQVAILLAPVAVVSWRYAEPLVVTVFSSRFVEAAGLLRWQTGMVAVACLDLALAMRVMGRTSSMLAVSLLTLAVNLGLLFLLVPRMGIEGAAVALLASHLAALTYLTWRATSILKMPVLEFLPLGGLAQVAVVALAAAVVLVPSFWTESLGILGIGLAAVLYGVVFAILLVSIRLPEALDLLQRIRSQLASSLARLRPGPT
jgi:O-antigen/teichoic acid export membrane protein